MATFGNFPDPLRGLGDITVEVDPATGRTKLVASGKSEDAIIKAFSSFFESDAGKVLLAAAGTYTAYKFGQWLFKKS